ncbi:MAG: Chitin synthase, class 7 [Alyxoria varia]|nr:MAG: Chitin synthase, class 7 [Alyxoria varia]
MGFGDFTTICAKAALPFCPLVGSSQLSPEAGIQPNCYPRTIEIANTVIFQGAASFAHIFALFMTVIMILHVRSKFTAVGRKEIITFFYIYLTLTVFSLLLDAGVVPPGSRTLPYFAAAQVGLSSGTCLSLCINGFLGFQVYEDGTALSVWLLRGLSFLWAGITFIVGLLTFQGWAGLGPENTVGLFVIMYVVNGLLLLVYVVMQVLLVYGTLVDRWPLGDIIFGVFFFIVGQVILYALGQPICDGASHYLDGLFFTTVCNLLAVMMVYKYWDTITTEDLEFSVGSKPGNWDVKDFQSVGQDDPFDGGMPGGRGSTICGPMGSDFSSSTLMQPGARGSTLSKSGSGGF